MGYAPQALIDHAALRHNLERARERAPRSKVWVVLKADAYGHGLERTARVLGDADGFAVARIDEALRLRQGGLDGPILITGGCYSREELQLASRQGLEIVIHQAQQLRLLEGLSLPSPVNTWLKVDTGMHRLGFPVGEISALAERLRRHPAIARLNLMTHLANADDRSDPTTSRQLACFDGIEKGSFEACSIANSAGLLGFEASHREWVRPGIMLYGVSPFLGESGAAQGLRPVMTLRSRVIAVKRCRAGDPVGYGGRYRCPEAMPLAVIAAGYGDGYPRHATDGTPVLVAGRRLSLAGRVSMDLISVDARAYPGVQVGDEAVLWGEGLPVEEIAEKAGTIAYELLCGVTRRVEFIDLDDLRQRAS